jgi:hypothetical protein
MFWLLIEPDHAEICLKRPGEEDLFVTARSDAFVRWHMGHLSWAVASKDITVEGPSQLARAFPSWNKRSHFAHVRPVQAS